jgi:hypothetical protein
MAEVPRRMRLTPPIDVHVDMANEFPGSFSYRIDNKALSPVPATDIEFFYPGASRRPLLFVDLYLASPEKSWAQSQGCYPITLPETRPEAPKDDATLAAANAEAQRHIKALDYEIRFAARETIWIYYVVLSAGLAADEELAIRSEPPERLAFVKDPTPAPLPGGAIAHRFVATKAQPLRRRPDITPRLLAAARANGATRVLLERLPTPSVKQIIAQRAAASTGPPAAATAASEVFVYL